MHHAIAPVLLALSLAAACGGAEPAGTTEPAGTAEPAGAAPAPAASDPAGFGQVCRASMSRNRECSAEFIPALVDLRIELDTPAGIAAEAHKSGGRDALIAQAQSEWHDDSTPAAIDATCDRMSSALAPEQQNAVADTARRCLDAEGCAAYVECMTPLQRQMLSH